MKSSILAGLLYTLAQICTVQARSSSHFMADSFTVGELSVWCILTFTFCIQSVQSLLRASQSSRGHRGPYVVLFPSVFLSAIFCVLEILIVIFTNSLPPGESAKGPVFTALYALEGLLDWLCVGPLFWSIIWFVKDRKEALLASQKLKDDEPSIFRTAHHAILISLVIVLTVTGIIISIISSNAVDIDSVQSAQYNMAFYITFVFWYVATTIDIGISSFNLNKEMREAKVSDAFTKVLFYVVTPIYAVNSIASIFFQIIYFPGLLPVDMSDTASDALSLLEDILMNGLFIAIVAALLVPRACGDLVMQLENRGSNPSLTLKLDQIDEVPRLLHDSPTNMEYEIDLIDTNENGTAPWTHSTGAEISHSALADRHPRKAPTRSMTLSERSLTAISTHLETRQKRKKVVEKLAAIESRMTADSQVFSAMSVVAVFVASLTSQLLSLAQSTFESASMSSRTSALPTASDNVNSCWFLATFLSLIAGCAASICAAMRYRMARDISSFHGRRFDDAVLKRKFEGPADRALTMMFVFVCIMMGISVITLITGLLVFVWSAQTSYVSVAMTVPAMVFLIGAGIAVTIWIFKK